MRKLDTGRCETCGKTFGYYLIHCGFGDCSYAYCDKCGCTAVLSYWSWDRSPNTPRLPDGCPPQQEICADWEPYLQSCECGGQFKKGASPRCPHCIERLSPELATTYIEKNAPGTKVGWTWQRNWHETYCIVIENRSVTDNYKYPTEELG